GLDEVRGARRQACALHAGMATFAEAAVSDRPA
ncbi:hypothetical protein, partial [Pseudomonas aeruginosa]